MPYLLSFEAHFDTVSDALTFYAQAQRSVEGKTVAKLSCPTKGTYLGPSPETYSQDGGT